MLAELVVSEQPLIYLDESTFHAYLRQSRTWSYSDSPVKFVLSRRRFSGVTLFGAFGNCLEAPVFMTAKATCIASFRDFIKTVIEAFKNNRRPYLVLDNHAAHVSK